MEKYELEALVDATDEKLQGSFPQNIYLRGFSSSALIYFIETPHGIIKLVPLNYRDKIITFVVPNSHVKNPSNIRYEFSAFRTLPFISADDSSDDEIYESDDNSEKQTKKVVNFEDVPSNKTLLRKFDKNKKFTNPQIKIEKGKIFFSIVPNFKFIQAKRTHNLLFFVLVLRLYRKDNDRQLCKCGFLFKKKAEGGGIESDVRTDDKLYLTENTNARRRKKRKRKKHDDRRPPREKVKRRGEKKKRKKRKKKKKKKKKLVDDPPKTSPSNKSNKNPRKRKRQNPEDEYVDETERSSKTPSKLTLVIPPTPRNQRSRRSSTRNRRKPKKELDTDFVRDYESDDDITKQIDITPPKFTTGKFTRQGKGKAKHPGGDMGEYHLSSPVHSRIELIEEFESPDECNGIILFKDSPSPTDDEIDPFGGYSLKTGFGSGFGPDYVSRICDFNRIQKKFQEIRKPRNLFDVNDAVEEKLDDLAPPNKRQKIFRGPF